MAKSVVTISWEDVPHLSQAQKDEIIKSIPPHLRDARTKGVPYIGPGLIYAAHVPPESIMINPIRIPNHWPRCFALDVGWNRTAALWGAWDREADIVYIYSEHYMGQEEPLLHASAIKGMDARTTSDWGVLRAKWIPGVIDPASRGRSQIDGKRLIDTYTNLGLNLDFADNSVEAGILEVWNRMSTSRLKVFNTLTNFFDEYRLYRRDDKGKPVKVKDHLMDCIRYLVMSGLNRACCPPANQEFNQDFSLAGMGAGMTFQTGWMGA